MEYFTSLLLVHELNKCSFSLVFFFFFFFNLDVTSPRPGNLLVLIYELPYWFVLDEKILELKFTQHFVHNINIVLQIRHIHVNAFLFNKYTL